MADQDGDNHGDSRVPGELFRPTAPRASSPAAIDLAEALGGLDRATRDFTRRLGEGQREVEEARLAGERVIREAVQAGAEADEDSASADLGALGDIAPSEPAEAGLASADAADPDLRADDFETAMEKAEREARIYLESAKRRADTLVQTMVGAVEHEASEARREAEEGIRARWHEVNVESTRHVENARRVSAQMVAERQDRIAKLSDGISGRAEALTAGMDDAGRVKEQFDAFVRALSVTADQIAREPSGGAAGEVREIRERPLPSAIAA